MGAWYYAQNNQQFGPHDEASIGNLIRSGAVSLTDLVWREGMPQWVELHTVPEFSALTASARPAPATAYAPAPAYSPPPPAPSYSPTPGYSPAAPVVGYAGYNPYEPKLPAGMAVASLVLGIISVVLACVWYIAIPCAILAIIFGAVAKGKVKAGVGGGEGMARAGLILGVIGICLPLTLVLLFVGFISSL